MSEQLETSAGSTNAVGRSFSTGVPNGKLAMWIFLASEVMFFTGLIGAYIVLRLGSDDWPDPGQILGVPVLAINTFILICSSVSMVIALQAAQDGIIPRMKFNLAVTAACGATFLTVKGFDYMHLVRDKGFRPDSSLFGSCYYTLTGFHGLHVLAGVITLIVLLVGANMGKFGQKNASVVECAGLYWHFVDLVWIVLFAILCLV